MVEVKQVNQYIQKLNYSVDSSKLYLIFLEYLNTCCFMRKKSLTSRVNLKLENVCNIYLNIAIKRLIRSIVPITIYSISRI